MSKMIQIRNVPDRLHRLLKARAAFEGLSLSDYLTRQLKTIADRPTVNELRERLHSRVPVSPSVAPVDAIREERERE